jgi:hypothetical protein
MHAAVKHVALRVLVKKVIVGWTCSLMGETVGFQTRWGRCLSEDKCVQSILFNETNLLFNVGLDQNYEMK